MLNIFSTTAPLFWHLNEDGIIGADKPILTYDCYMEIDVKVLANQPKRG
jgi:hypothetical protein